MSYPVTNRISRRAKNRKRPRYWLRRLLILLMILLPVGVWYGWDFVDSLKVAPASAAPRVVAGRPVFVAVMGVDERENDVGRSDTLVLMRLDPTADQVSIINIPRDTLAMVDGEPAKINAAYAAGGPEETTEVLADLLDIERPYYVTLNFEAFEELINQVGGVEIDVEKHYVYDDPFQDLHIDIPAGRQLLLGEQALHYVRLRYDGVTNSDIARIERQQKFLQAFKEKVPSHWTRIPDMIRTIQKYVKTNIPEADQMKLAKALFDARSNVAMQTLPGAPDDSTGDWILSREGWSEVTRSWTSQ
ncbi:MAG TPA: LCP family protein [Symbiobacteriaceae bacterium]|nr:LCP family protein [Symbiobacteriaceae bacterium]